jgi:hypothetical protein
MSAAAAVTTSLYIPHIFANFDKDFVASVFEKLKIGKVKNIDFILKTNGQCKEYNAAYIHFEYWNDTIVARNFHARVVNPNEEARIVYDEPWFWVVLENKARKYVPGERKPRIQLDEPVQKVAFIPEPVTVATIEMEVEEDDDSSIDTLGRRAMELDEGYDMDDDDDMEIERDQEEEEELDNMEWLEDVVEENRLMEVDEAIEEEDERNLDEIADAIEEVETQMMEVEATMHQEEDHMIYIDGRYVHTLEQENDTLRQESFALRVQLQQYIDMYNKEVIKTSALVDVITSIAKNA